MVITGYTAKSAKELTGAVQKVTGEQLRNSVTTPNALSMLKGKTTGLYITETSGESGAKGQVIERGSPPWQRQPTVTSARCSSWMA